MHENDRVSLERLCRSGARGPPANGRLSRRGDGKLDSLLKKPHGTATTLVMTPVQLLKRLCAVMVKPRIHLTRFFGVFAAASSARAQVVPARVTEPPAEVTPPQLELEAPPPSARSPGPPPAPRLDWAGLLRRTWGFDVFACPCGGRRRVLALITSPVIARKILGLPSSAGSRLPPLQQPTGPPQLPLL